MSRKAPTSPSRSSISGMFRNFGGTEPRNISPWRHRIYQQTTNTAADGLKTYLLHPVEETYLQVRCFRVDMGVYGKASDPHALPDSHCYSHPEPGGCGELDVILKCNRTALHKTVFGLHERFRHHPVSEKSGLEVITSLDDELPLPLHLPTQTQSSPTTASASSSCLWSSPASTLVSAVTSLCGTASTPEHSIELADRRHQEALKARDFDIDEFWYPVEAGHAAITGEAAATLGSPVHMPAPSSSTQPEEIEERDSPPTPALSAASMDVPEAMSQGQILPPPLPLAVADRVLGTPGTDQARNGREALSGVPLVQGTWRSTQDRPRWDGELLETEEDWMWVPFLAPG